MRCPKCKNATELALIEVHDEVGKTDFGVIRFDGFGNAVPPSDFWFEPGDPTAVYVECGQCLHVWKPRGSRAVVSPVRGEPTETVTVTAEEAEFIADAISTAYPKDAAAQEWWAVADRLRKLEEDHAE